MPTTYREWVDCRTHSLLFPASIRCPDCAETGPRGAATSPSKRVEIVPSRGGGR
jgi:hypothetical protein